MVNLLLTRGASTTPINSQSYDALRLAAEGGFAVIVEALVRTCDQRIPNIDNTTSEGNTALHLAAWNGHAEVVDILLNKSADWTAKNNSGYTPFHLAA
ncbi:ankyrin, partial [Thozetella sp. PMI_491]